MTFDRSDSVIVYVYKKYCSSVSSSVAMHSHRLQDTELKLCIYVMDSPLQVMERVINSGDTLGTAFEVAQFAQFSK